MRQLTPKTIDALPPAQGKRYEVRDILLPGLHLRVSASGSKVFYLSKRVDHRMRRIKVGSWPILSLKDARDKARDILRLIELGEFDQDEPEIEEVHALTLKEVIPQFIELYAKLRTRDRWLRGVQDVAELSGGIGTARRIARVDFAATGVSFAEGPTGNRVLLLSAEDNWPRVTLHRLLKAGANIDNLHHMRRFRSLTDERLEALREHMHSWRPDLVVIDTISAYMGGGRDTHRQNEVGEFLALLTEMAEETGAAIVALAHLNKQGSEHPLYRIVGSIGFVASIRSALFFGTDPSNRERVALAHGKANQSEKGRTIIFEKIGGGRTDVPVLRPVAFSDADETDICRVKKKPVGRPGTEHEEGAAFVLQFLTDEPVPWRAIEKAADRRSIASPGTLNIVRAELAKDGRIVQVGRGPKRSGNSVTYQPKRTPDPRSK